MLEFEMWIDDNLVVSERKAGLGKTLHGAYSGNTAVFKNDSCYRRGFLFFLSCCWLGLGRHAYLLSQNIGADWICIVFLSIASIMIQYYDILRFL